MPRNQQHVYDPQQMRALAGVPLPDKIKCARCSKFKNQASFSNKQLTDARYEVRHHGQNARYQIKCQRCSGQTIHEIECSVCGVTKGLEAFAKLQRRKVDSAECFQCTEKRLDLDPVDDTVYDNNDRNRAFVAADAADGYYPSVFETSTEASDTASEWQDPEDDDGKDGGVDLSKEFASKLRKMSLSDNSNMNTLIESEYDRGSQVSDSDGWNRVQARSWHTKSYNNTSSAISTGFDPTKYSSRSVSGSQRSFTSSYAERSATMSNKGGFAKIRAYDPKKDPDRPTVAPPVQEEWSSDEEVGNYDDDDDSDDDTLI